MGRLWLNGEQVVAVKYLTGRDGQTLCGERGEPVDNRPHATFETATGRRRTPAILKALRSHPF